MSSNRVDKYSGPTKLDKHPYGTIWSNISEENMVVRYIQLSEDQDAPNWQILGQFLEICLLDKMEDPIFVAMCLDRYKR